MTIKGVVREGAENGCLLVDGYLLIGGSRDVLNAFRSVAVTGQVMTGLTSRCQEGTPLRVDRVVAVTSPSTELPGNP